MKKFDSIFLGAIGHPEGNPRNEHKADGAISQVSREEDVEATGCSAV